MVGAEVSRLADDFMVVRCKPDEKLPCGNTHHWLPNSDADACMSTGKKFGLFTRRHHCRLTGNIYCDAVCKQKG